MPRSDLDGIALFEGLPAAHKARLAELLRASKVPSRAYVMSLEQAADLVYVLVDGTVRVQAEQEDGTIVILAFLGPGDTVGEMSALEEGTRRSATVMTLEPCRFLSMDRVTFKACLETMPRLALNLLGVMSRRLRLADQRIQSLATLDVRGRVARQLAAFAGEYGLPKNGGLVIDLRLTQGDLASIVGASRERVNRVMVGFKRSELIASDSRHRIFVRDAEELIRRYG